MILQVSGPPTRLAGWIPLQSASLLHLTTGLNLMPRVSGKDKSPAVPPGATRSRRQSRNGQPRQKSREVISFNKNLMTKTALESILVFATNRWPSVIWILGQFAPWMARIQLAWLTETKSNPAWLPNTANGLRSQFKTFTDKTVNRNFNVSELQEKVMKIYREQLSKMQTDHGLLSTWSSNNSSATTPTPESFSDMRNMLQSIQADVILGQLREAFVLLSGHMLYTEEGYSTLVKDSHWNPRYVPHAEHFIAQVMACPEDEIKDFVQALNDRFRARIPQDQFLPLYKLCKGSTWVEATRILQQGGPINSLQPPSSITDTTTTTPISVDDPAGSKGRDSPTIILESSANTSGVGRVTRSRTRASNSGDQATVDESKELQDSILKGQEKFRDGVTARIEAYLTPWQSTPTLRACNRDGFCLLHVLVYHHLQGTLKLYRLGDNTSKEVKLRRFVQQGGLTEPEFFKGSDSNLQAIWNVLRANIQHLVPTG